MSQFSKEQIAAWRESDRKHHFHAMTAPRQHKQGSADGLFLTHAEGIYLYDSDGKRYQDALSGLGCVNIGYGNERLADAAAEAMKELSFQNTYFGATNRWACEFSEKLAQHAPEGFDHFFYANSGSEANESAIKMAWHYWRLKGKPGKKTIISRELGYHGTTIFACSATGMEVYHPQFALPVETPLLSKIPGTYYWRDGAGLTAEEYGKKSAQDLEAHIKQLGADNVAAFIAEPIIGAGGMITPPPGYWQEINRICHKYDVLLIVDEVVTGFGKTGKWFATETFGIDADFITMAKGITSAYVPLSAVAVGGRASEVLLQDEELFVHGFTNNAHPVTMATALANLSVIEEQHLVETVNDELGPKFAQCLQELSPHPLVGEVRSCGVIGAIELVTDSEGNIAQAFADLAVERGVMVRPIGQATIGMVLPLITTGEQVDDLFDVLREVLAELSQQV